MYFKMTPQRDNYAEVSAVLHAGHKKSEVENLVGVSRTTVYAINKRIEDGESVNRPQAGVERLMWIVIACGMPFEGLLCMRDTI